MTTTDRELLERAAKAAGMRAGNGPGEYAWHPGLGCLSTLDRFRREAPWNPLHDGGDAFRLAVKRRFTVAIRPHEVEVFCEASGECLASVHTNGVNHEEATRRAIVIAAAMAGEGE